MTMRGTRFEAVSWIQPTVAGQLRAIRAEAMSPASDLLHGSADVVSKRTGTALSDDIDTYCLFFLCGTVSSVRELNCHTLYLSSVALITSVYLNVSAMTQNIFIRNRLTVR